MEKRYYVYILSSWSRALYTGVTNDLERRVMVHKQRLVKGFAKRFRIHRLVYYESFSDVRDALRREKQIKSWRREKKVALIKAANPGWQDLAANWLRSPSERANRRDPSPRLPARAGSRSSG